MHRTFVLSGLMLSLASFASFAGCTFHAETSFVAYGGTENGGAGKASDRRQTQAGPTVAARPEPGSGQSAAHAEDGPATPANDAAQASPVPRERPPVSISEVRTGTPNRVASEPAPGAPPPSEARAASAPASMPRATTDAEIVERGPRTTVVQTGLTSRPVRVDGANTDTSNTSPLRSPRPAMDEQTRKINASNIANNGRDEQRIAPRPTPSVAGGRDNATLVRPAKSPSATNAGADMPIGKRQGAARPLNTGAIDKKLLANPEMQKPDDPKTAPGVPADVRVR